MKTLLSISCAVALASSVAIPASAHVLWGAEHDARAKALAAAVVPAETASALTSTPIKSADATLSIWGHGGQSEFAGMTSAQMVTFVKAWKKMNPTLTTVEIITCDARHAQDDTYEAFAEAVVKGLAGTGVVVKALPKGQTAESESILWAGAQYFCYMTAKTTAVFNEVNQKLETGINGGSKSYEICDQLAKGKAKDPKGGQYTVNYGIVKNLRSNLVVVR